MKHQTCCFTGHRNIPTDEVPIVMQQTEHHIRELVKRGVTFFGVGGAIGYDTLSAQLLFKLRKTSYPHIKIILVYPFDGFTSRWSKDQQREYARLLPQYDKIVKITQTDSKASYLQRDRHLVDCSAHCICYCNRQSGGTAYTVRYARSKGVSIWNTASFDISSL